MQVRNENSGKGDMRVKTRQDSTASQGHKLGPARSSKLKPQLCWNILWGGQNVEALVSERLNIE